MFSTFVINLDKDTERMQFMHQQLTSLGISYHRESAVLGSSYTPTEEEYSAALAIEKGGHALLPGEIGCAVSHARVIEKIVNEQIPYALVLEDDVELPPDFKYVIEAQITKKHTWEYLLFDYVDVGPRYLQLWFRGVFQNYRKTEGVIAITSFLCKHILKALYIVPLSLLEYVRDKIRVSFPGPVIFFRPVYFAGAYLVTYSGAVKLYALSKPVRYTADHLPNKARLLNKLIFRCYAPLSVRQQKKKFGSSILNLSGSQLK